MPVIAVKKTKYSLFLLVAILFLLILFFRMIPGKGREKGVEGFRQRVEKRAEVSFRKFHFTEREQGERKWEIRADRAERFLKDSRVHMDQVKIEVLLEKGDVLRMAGRKGDYWEKKQRVVLRGDVTVQSDSGYTLYAKQLVWEAGKGLLSSDQPVRLKTACDQVRGDRIRYWPDRKKLEVEGHVRMVILPGPGSGKEWQG
ncbi:MAG: LPS export ABC transporter periplasmic protein LptC [Deltaproteobacteria bacterium]|nr:LPS export ABC transporter periplasmic protein LptC [Deltaproteobacteria bacterium]